MKAAVTGANGMVGRHIVARLRDRGDHIRVLRRHGGEAVGKEETVTGDLNDVDLLRKLLDGTDTLFHCAAELNDESRMQQVNVEATRRLAQLASELGIDTFIHISSAGVTGPLRDPLVDESTPCHPNSLYERSKWEAEQLLFGLEAEKMRICILRPTNVVDVLRPGIIAAPMRNSWRDRLTWWVRGAECAHIVHAGDIAAAALFCADNCECSGIYIVGDDEESLNTVAGVVAYYNYLQAGEEGEPKLPYSLPVFVPNLIRRLRRGPSLHGRVRFSSAKLRRLGFNPPLGFRGAIREVSMGRNA
jgi:nucleoside-diphosphate-sugar epimerase